MEIEELLANKKLLQEIEKVWNGLAVGSCQLCFLNGSFKTTGIRQPIIGYGHNVIKEAGMYAKYSLNSFFVLRKTQNSKDFAGVKHGSWWLLETKEGAIIISRSGES